MTEINWNIFRAKFNQRESNSFENLSYQLFCFEHNQPYGIFRFKNQTGIEVEPISVGNDSIGFQAKYYETKLAENKADIIDSLKKAKSKNPTLTKLYIYLNQEFSESSKKEIKNPTYKNEIEQEALKLDLIIVWRVPSNFEIQLADNQNRHIAEFYFTNGSNIIDFLSGITSHTENILFSIQNDIKFGNQIIHINRDIIISELKTSQKDITIVNGDGGCGKTAIIKDLYAEIKDYIPFYVFKAVEFDVQNIQGIFSRYGHNTFEDFLEIHENEPQKILVIDSAESLSEINSHETFKEFLSALLKNSWQIIFTTRNNYLDDLKFQFINIYRVPFSSVFIENPTQKELTELSEIYKFNIPDDIPIQELLRNLFYLDEYLKNYDQFDKTTNFSHFKQILWGKKIQNSSFTQKNTHIQRENCFLEIAKERIDSGRFYITPTNCSEDILALLQRDEIIKYDTNNGGYFITHDLYEEWALEVLIERAYNTSESYSDFIITIGNSLAIRRAFRKWLSQKIHESLSDIEPFISQTIIDSNVDTFWRDEIFITILLSDYSNNFFTQFQNFIFENNFYFLKRTIFLLRIACKELDEFHNHLYENSNLKYLFTKPKGSGWKSVISLIFNNHSLFNDKHIHFFIPVLIEWSKKNPYGETTRQAGLIALELYRKFEYEDEFKYTNLENEIVKIVLNTSLEIKEELKVIITEIISNGEINRNAPYFELVNSILNAKYENILIIKALPKEVISIARKFWIDEQPSESHYYSTYEKEDSFGISKIWHSEYSPASAYQTPIYRLLHYDFPTTINFLIELMNKVISNYQKSKFAGNLEEIILPISKDKSQKQFISHDFWCMYRGAAHSPELLQSIHMALEKYLLEITQETTEDIIESWLIHILEKSTSASLTAVVLSVLKANYGRFFNVAKILFSSPEILLYDRICTHSEYQISKLANFGKGWNPLNKYYEDERESSSNKSHRGSTLVEMIINYQFFRDEMTSDEVADERQKDIYKIIDELYIKFPEKPNSSDKYMSKRLLIAQLDRRKMTPVTEKKGNQLLINLNSEIAPELKEHSNEALKDLENFSKYIPLKLWANNKFDNRTQATDCEKYDNEPSLALAQTKEILNELSSQSGEKFLLFNETTPAFVCATLLKDFSDKFVEEDLKYCKDVIFKYAILHLNPNYDYQISDGVEVAISALPAVAKLFPETLPDIKTLLLFTLLDNFSIGEYKRICDYAIETIYSGMLALDGEMNKQFIAAFLKFKPLHSKMKPSGLQNFHKRDNILEKFSKKYNKELKNFADGKIVLDDDGVELNSIEILEIVFKLIPVDTQDKQLLNLVLKIMPVTAKQLLVYDKDFKFKYSFRAKFFSRFAYFLLYRDLQTIEIFAKPFVEFLTDTNESVYFLQEVIFTQDKLNKYEEFWKIWNIFYSSIINLCKTGRGRYTTELVQTYLLAGKNWNSESRDWHSLKNREKMFYQKIVNDIGNSPSVLYSISKNLNGIASIFLNDGIKWLSEIIDKQNYTGNSQLEENTVFYLENLIRKYIYLNREKVKKDIRVKKQVLIILNFLIQKTSVNAYLLREDIL